MENLLFNSWESLLRTIALTVLAYISLILLLRITGKRTLSKMNTFDFIVTIALGSSFATVVLSKKVTLADGVAVFFMLVTLQYFITWLSVRVKKFKQFVTGTPTLLLYKGEVLEKSIKKERILKEELYVVARSKGISNLNEIDAVILETNGELTVIKELEPKAETIKDAEGKLEKNI